MLKISSTISKYQLTFGLYHWCASRAFIKKDNRGLDLPRRYKVAALSTSEGIAPERMIGREA